LTVVSDYVGVTIFIAALVLGTVALSKLVMFLGRAVDRPCDSVLMRGAEVTLTRGYKYFLISAGLRTFSAAEPLTIGRALMLGLLAPSAWEKYEILCFPENPGGSLYDAAIVRDALHAKYPKGL
jgi:hypothetical protein